MLTDTHVHLDLQEYAADLPAVLMASRAAGVGRWIVPAVSASAWPWLTRLHLQHPGLFYALGLHPWFLAEESDASLQQLADWLERLPPGLVAIGECGLDSKVTVAMDLQWHYLQAQVALACQHRLPLILHSRGGHEPLLGLLRRVRPPAGGVLHAFSGSLQQAEQFIELGFALGIGGVITYSRAQKTRRAVAALPAQWLILETDGPTMPLAGYQGQRNTPERVVNVLAELGALRGEEPQHLAEQIACNVLRLFPRLSHASDPQGSPVPHLAG